MVFIGTMILWFGWLGFNGGSALAPSKLAVLASYVTFLSASVGGLTWVLVDVVIRGKKLTVTGFCEGIVVGLVCITPGAGFVKPWAALIFGSTGAVIGNVASSRLTLKLGAEDTLDSFAGHGVGGLWGCFLTGIFASQNVAKINGLTILPGAIDGSGMLLGYQLAAMAAIAGYSFVVSFILLFVLDRTLGISIRVLQPNAKLNRAQRLAKRLRTVCSTTPAMTPAQALAIHSFQHPELGESAYHGTMHIISEDGKMTTVYSYR